MLQENNHLEAAGYARRRRAHHLQAVAQGHDGLQGGDAVGKRSEGVKDMQRKRQRRRNNNKKRSESARKREERGRDLRGDGRAAEKSWIHNEEAKTHTHTEREREEKEES